MQLVVLNHGIFGSNTYLLFDGQDCAIIDCGSKATDIKRALDEHHLNVKYIILTHGHFDHTYHVKSVKDMTGAQVCLHEAELELYQNLNENGFNFFGFNQSMELLAPDILLRDGQRLHLGSLQLEVIHTPGHSPGSICIKADNLLFTGDTLFAMSVGRTDLFRGSAKALNESITKKLFTLADEVIVYPGHGPKTTLGYEKVNNPYV